MASNEENNRKTVLEELKKNKRGLSITGIEKNTNLTRTQIRTAVSYLLGSKQIEEEQVGMAKVYYAI